PPATTAAPPPTLTGTAPPTTAPPATTPPPTPTTTATTTATTPPPTQTVDTSALQPLLTPLAQKHAKGAKPEGQALAGVLQQGQSLQQPLQLAASGSRCYTVIAVGAPSVTAIKIEFWSNMPPLPPTIVAQSQASTNPSFLAESPNCFKNLLPIPGMVMMKVTAEGGSGPVMAQLYAKLLPRVHLGGGGGGPLGGGSRDLSQVRPLCHLPPTAGLAPSRRKAQFSRA
ncbi:MAG: hypothetical protein RMJ98_23100, partial [Myxococcales bacterium]|nr:hypothetical protein [Myxococcales bacterium]